MGVNLIGNTDTYDVITSDRLDRKGDENKMVKVTEIAAEKLKETISKQKNPESIMLRIAFGGFG